jgi:hypothetical protein
MSDLAPRNAFDMTTQLAALAAEYAQLSVAALAAAVHAQEIESRGGGR